jgi:hypothetical protein
MVICRRGKSEITTEITCFNKKTWIKLVSINCISGEAIHPSTDEPTILNLLPWVLYTVVIFMERDPRQVAVSQS